MRCPLRHTAREPFLKIHFWAKVLSGKKKLFSQAVPGLPDGLFKPKIEISVNFGGSGR
jgi:hypothetical protein